MKQKITEILMLPLRPRRRFVLLVTGVVLVAMSTYVIDPGTKVPPFSLLVLWGDIFCAFRHGQWSVLEFLTVLGMHVLLTAVYAGVAWVIGWSLAALGSLVMTIARSKDRK